MLCISWEGSRENSVSGSQRFYATGRQGGVEWIRARGMRIRSLIDFCCSKH